MSTSKEKDELISCMACNVQLERDHSGIKCD